MTAFDPNMKSSLKSKGYIDFMVDIASCEYECYHQIFKKICNSIHWTDGWRQDDLKYEWRDTNPVQTYPMPSDLRLGSADGSNLVIQDTQKSQFVLTTSGEPTFILITIFNL